MPSLAEQIACVKREIGLRERVYPKFIANGKLKQAKADHELAAMKAVLASLEMLDQPAKTLLDRLPTRN